MHHHGKPILQDEEKAGQNAGLGKPALPEKLEGDGKADIAMVAVAGALNEGDALGGLAGRRPEAQVRR